MSDTTEDELRKDVINSLSIVQLHRPDSLGEAVIETEASRIMSIIHQAKKDLLAEVRDKVPRFKLNSIDELEPVDSVATVNFGNGYNRGISDTLAAIKEIEEGL